MSEKPTIEHQPKQDLPDTLPKWQPSAEQKNAMAELSRALNRNPAWDLLIYHLQVEMTNNLLKSEMTTEQIESLREELKALQRVKQRIQGVSNRHN